MKHKVGDLVSWDDSDYGEKGTDIGFISSGFVTAGDKEFYKIDWSSGAGKNTIYTKSNIEHFKFTLKNLLGETNE
jgi:hypothetical protein